MLKLDVITVGKLKEDYLKKACEEYLKRLGAFVRTQVIELPEYKMPQNPSEAQIAACIQAEGESILAKIPAQSYVVAMCIEGKMLSSEELAQTMMQVQNRGMSQISLLIGGSWGLSDSVKARADLKLSMSRMTFPHQLARVMLLEQLYRACSINNHSKYHK